MPLCWVVLKRYRSCHDQQVGTDGSVLNQHDKKYEDRIIHDQNHKQILHCHPSAVDGRAASYHHHP